MTCPACLAPLPEGPAETYRRCRGCGSFAFVSATGDAAANHDTFDPQFAQAATPVENPARRLAFARGLRLDRAVRPLAHRRRDRQLAAIARRSAVGRTLELGFGDGSHLAALLAAGVDARGVDLSPEAVTRFARLHPRWADRVGTAWPDDAFDTVYACAVLEHTDDPGAFLARAAAHLRPGGRIALVAQPMLAPVPPAASFDAATDISFWAPCHRLIPSRRGFRTLAARAGVRVVAESYHDDYLYRLLSLHIARGYRDVATLRSPFPDHPGLPPLPTLRRLALQAVFCRSLAWRADLLLARTGDPA